MHFGVRQHIAIRGERQSDRVGMCAGAEHQATAAVQGRDAGKAAQLWRRGEYSGLSRSLQLREPQVATLSSILPPDWGCSAGSAVLPSQASSGAGRFSYRERRRKLVNSASSMECNSLFAV